MATVINSYTGLPDETGSGGGGGGGSPGGTSGQVQFNNAGAFDGFTISGDATLSTSTGVATLATVNSSTGTYAGLTVNAKGLVTAAIAISPRTACRLATTGPLTANYNNGTSGVGATLTNAASQVSLTIDSILAAVGDRILVANQASTIQNGIYTVTNAGSVSTNWVLTRTTDFDNSTAGNVTQGSTIAVSAGTINAGSIYVANATGPFILGTSAITFVQNAAGSVVGGYVGSISNSDGTLTISPTTGSAVASLNLANPNTWTATQTHSAANIATDTTTGMKIGTATNQKIAFYNSTPIVKPSGNALTALGNLGIVTSPVIDGFIGWTTGTPGGAALSASQLSGFFTAPYSGTISGYYINLDQGTLTFKTWKIASGTAVPTSANSINTSGVGISSGTAINSSTTSDFTTTTITAGDIIGFAITAVALATYASGGIILTRSS